MKTTFTTIFSRNFIFSVVTAAVLATSCTSETPEKSSVKSADTANDSKTEIAQENLHTTAPAKELKVTQNETEFEDSDFTNVR